MSAVARALDVLMRLELPIATVSLANMRESHFVRARRAKGQKGAVLLGLRPFRVPAAPLIITLTRVASRRLDDDNVQGAMKSIRDAIAAWLGIDDGSDLLTWRYGQQPRAGKRRVFARNGHMSEVSDQAVRIEIASP